MARDAADLRSSDWSRSNGGGVRAPRVIVFRGDLLPISETFIWEQLRFYRRWQPVLAGKRLVPGGLAADTDPVLLDEDPGRRSRITRAMQYAGLSPLPAFRKLAGTGALLAHAHFGTDATDFWPYVKKLGIPMLVTLHGYDINTNFEWWRSGAGGERRRRYPDRLLAMARNPGVRFIAVSTAIQRRAIEAGVPAQKITTHYTGIDTEFFTRGSKPLDHRPESILFVGRLVEKKGVHVLLRAFRQIADRHPGAELRIAGDGPLRDEIESTIRDWGLRATLLGNCDRERILSEMHEARILCLPSITASNGDAEGFGMVLLEGQSCGLPVITSARGGAEEGIIHGSTGFAIPEGDAGALAGHLDQLLGDPSLLASMSAAAASFVRSNFDIRQHAEELEILYDLCCQDSRPRK